MKRIADDDTESTLCRALQLVDFMLPKECIRDVRGVEDVLNVVTKLAFQGLTPCRDFPIGEFGPGFTWYACPAMVSITKKPRYNLTPECRAMLRSFSLQVLEHLLALFANSSKVKKFTIQPEHSDLPKCLFWDLVVLFPCSIVLEDWHESYFGVILDVVDTLIDKKLAAKSSTLCDGILRIVFLITLVADSRCSQRPFAELVAQKMFKPLVKTVLRQFGHADEDPSQQLVRKQFCPLFLRWLNWIPCHNIQALSCVVSIGSHLYALDSSKRTKFAGKHGKYALLKCVRLTSAYFNVDINEGDESIVLHRAYCIAFATALVPCLPLDDDEVVEAITNWFALALSWASDARNGTQLCDNLGLFAQLVLEETIHGKITFQDTFVNGLIAKFTCDPLFYLRGVFAQLQVSKDSIHSVLHSTRSLSRCPVARTLAALINMFSTTPGRTKGMLTECRRVVIFVLQHSMCTECWHQVLGVANQHVCQPYDLLLHDEHMPTEASLFLLQRYLAQCEEENGLMDFKVSATITSRGLLCKLSEDWFELLIKHWPWGSRSDVDVITAMRDLFPRKRYSVLCYAMKKLPDLSHLMLQWITDEVQSVGFSTCCVGDPRALEMLFMLKTPILSGIVIDAARQYVETHISPWFERTDRVGLLLNCETVKWCVSFMEGSRLQHKFFIETTLYDVFTEFMDGGKLYCDAKTAGCAEQKVWALIKQKWKIVCEWMVDTDRRHLVEDTKPHYTAIMSGKSSVKPRPMSYFSELRYAWLKLVCVVCAH